MEWVIQFLEELRVASLGTLLGLGACDGRAAHLSGPGRKEPVPPCGSATVCFLKGSPS